MHACLSKLAGSSNRSLNAEIVHRLAQTLGEDFAAGQPAAQPVLAESWPRCESKQIGRASCRERV